VGFYRDHHGRGKTAYNNDAIPTGVQDQIGSSCPLTAELRCVPKVDLAVRVTEQYRREGSSTIQPTNSFKNFLVDRRAMRAFYAGLVTSGPMRVPGFPCTVPKFGSIQRKLR
jgi:hypothetical protein